MIDRTLLTEALDKAVFIDIGLEESKAVVALREAARWVRDFPTDEQVEAAAKVLYEYANDFEWDHEVAVEPDSPYRNMARLMLEAARV